jgi:hypothetical protein
MEIRDYKNGDEHQIKELFEFVFKQKYSLDLWTWRFLNNPAGQKKIKLMWEDDLLIGQYAVSPVNIEINGQLFNSALSLGTMTHPNFEGKGVFKNLAKALYSDLQKNGCIGVWGFPNNNSHGGFINSLAWKNLGVQHSLEIKTNKLSSNDKILNNFNEFKIEKFELQHEEFINNLVDKNSIIRVAKSKDYLNWRYTEKPEVNYYKYYGEVEGNKFLVVCKVYFNNQSSTNYLNILELHVENYSIINSLLANIVSNIGVEILNINIWKSLYSAEHLKLERIGFVLSNPQTYAGILPLTENVEILTDFRNWNLNMGDSDVF